SFDLHDADAAHVHRMQRVEEAERRNLDADLATGGKECRAFANGDRLSIDRQRHRARRTALLGVGGDRGSLELDESGHPERYSLSSRAERGISRPAAGV